MSDSNYKELRRLGKKMRQYQRERDRWTSKESKARAYDYEKRFDELLFAMDQLDAMQAANEGKQLSLLGDDDAVTTAVRNGSGGVL